MNEYKIQLESREDLSYLRDELNKYFVEEDISESIKQQVTFKIRY